MGSGFLTLGDSIDVVRFLGCPTLSDWCVMRSKDGDVQCFSERMSWLVERRFWSEEKGLSPGPETWLSCAGSQRQRHWERWLRPARRRLAQLPIRGLVSGARTVCSIPSSKLRCVEGGVIFAAWRLGQYAISSSPS